MSDRPRVICLMSSSLDGGLHASRYSDSPDGTPKEWSALYEALHDELGGDAWLVGRTTMAEMAKGEPHAPTHVPAVQRPHRLAKTDGESYAIAVDTHGELHFRGDSVGGDHAVVLLGGGVGDAHLAELAADGVSYIVSSGEHVDLAQSLAILKRELGIETLLLEGGAKIVGSFFDARLVDELHLIVAPALDARVGFEPWITADDDGVKGKARLSLRDVARLDHGAVHLHYDVAPA